MVTAPEKIVTDAGWDKIKLPEVCKFFTLEEIRDCYISLGADISELLSDEDFDLYLEEEEEVEEFLNNYDWESEEVKDREVKVVVAKATYENTQWGRMISTHACTGFSNWLVCWEIGRALYKACACMCRKIPR